MHKRILIVEDEASIREMVAFALRKALMEVHFASDANVALAAIAKHLRLDTARLDATWNERP